MPPYVYFAFCVIVFVSIVIGIAEAVRTYFHGYHSDIFWNAFTSFLFSFLILFFIAVIFGALTFAILNLIGVAE